MPVNTPSLAISMTLILAHGDIRTLAVPLAIFLALIASVAGAGYLAQERRFGVSLLVSLPSFLVPFGILLYRGADDAEDFQVFLLSLVPAAIYGCIGFVSWRASSKEAASRKSSS